MGDYGVGLQSLSPVDFNRFVNNHSLFSPENSPRTMQDEILLEKSAAKQQLSPSCRQISEQNCEGVVRNGHLEIATSQIDDKCIENNINSSSMPLEANSQLITSLATVSQNFWTPPQVHEDAFNQGQGAFQNVNGTVSFQHLPPNAILNAGNIMQAAHVTHNLSQRRAITAQHNFPQRPMQQGMILNNAKNYPQWSNAHGQPHATLSPWTQAQLQQHHQHQRRSVPNMNIPAFAQLKNIKTNFPQTQQSLSVIAPSKFRRSTSFPSQIHQATFPKPTADYVGLDDAQRENYMSYQVYSMYIEQK